ncbi:hypothetical protein GCM10008922_14700 [Faecalicatena contorta]
MLVGCTDNISDSGDRAGKIPEEIPLRPGVNTQAGILMPKCEGIITPEFFAVLHQLLDIGPVIFIIIGFF